MNALANAPDSLVTPSPDSRVETMASAADAALV